MESLKAVFADNVTFGFFALIAIITFWVLVYFAKDELGFKWSAFFVLLWCGILAIFLWQGFNPFIFIVISIVLDIILTLAVFGGDIKA